MNFRVDDWAALAPGLTTREDWLGWFARPCQPEGEVQTDLSWVPAGLRRRVSPLGRAALTVAARCQPPEPCPIVYASRYGDLQATSDLLQQLAREGLVSPMGFSLAVHNAAVGIYSIARQDRTATTSLAASEDLAEAACTEAACLLASGVGSVLVVCCDEPAPDAYRANAADELFRYAWACRLSAAPVGGFSLATVEGEAPAGARTGCVQHPTLGVLALLAGAGEEQLLSATGRYQWRRHG